jgi:O-antigen ligase
MKLLFALLLFCSVLLGAICALFGGELALVLFLLLFPLGFVLADYRIGAVLCIMALPLATLKVFAHLPGLNMVTVLVIITLASFLIRNFMRTRGIVKVPTIMLCFYVLPIAWAAAIGLTHRHEVNALMVVELGVGFTSSLQYLIGYFIKPMFLLIAAWLIGNAVKESKNPVLFVIPVAISILLPALILLAYIAISGLGLKVLASSAARGFLTSLGLHANEFGAMFAVGVILLMFMIPVVKGLFYRLVLSGIAGIVLVALALTFSRGGYVALMLGATYFVISQRRVRLAFGALVLFVMIALAAPQTIWDRAMVGISDGNSNVTSSRLQDDELTAGRFWLWRQTFPAFYNGPVLGSGIASQAWSGAAKSGLIHTIHTHNLYLSILYDVGLLGFVLVISFFMYVYRTFKTLAQRPDLPPVLVAAFRGSAVSMLGLGVFGFTNGLFWPQTWQVYMWIMFGIAMAYLTEAERTSLRIFPARSVLKKSMVGHPG